MVDIAGERVRLAAQGLTMVTRASWGAVQDYTTGRPVVMPARGFVLHISVTQDPDDLAGHEDDSMRAIERIGTQRFGTQVGFPYNAAAFDTGRLYEGQPLTRRGAHTVNALEVAGFPHDMNWEWRALCLPQLVGDDVTDVQIDAAARWAGAQIRAGYARLDARWSGHRDYANKACPGDKGYARIADLNELTRDYADQRPTPVPPPPPPEENMRIIDCSGEPAMIVFGDRTYTELNKAQRDAWRSANVPAAGVTPAERSEILSFLTRVNVGS